MILLANSEAYPGIEYSARQLNEGQDGLLSLIEGIKRVELDPRVRTVGYGRSEEHTSELQSQR